MKLTTITISKLTAKLASSACAVLLLSGIVANTAVAQERYAMLSRSAKPLPVYNTVDEDTTMVRKPKPVVNTSSFDLMAASPLDESLVMDFAAKKKLDTKANASLTNEEVYPKVGWNDFEKYVNALAIATDGKTGSVQLSFVVSSNGNLSNFKVINSLSEAANAKAIELVKNGPSWVGNAAVPNKQVTVTVKFHSVNTGPVFL